MEKTQIKTLDEIDLLESDKIIVREELKRWIRHKQRIQKHYHRKDWIYQIYQAEVVVLKEFLNKIKNDPKSIKR